MPSGICIYLGEALARYNFGEGHPFGPHRYGAFADELARRGLEPRLRVCKPVAATRQEIAWFHTDAYIKRVQTLSEQGTGLLDQGDTPAFPGIYQAAATVVGSTLAAVRQVAEGACRRAFVPIAGLHHARRDRAAGFCVFNDCGVAIEALRRRYNIRRVAYVDIDAHHGDGIYYSFEVDPELFIVDFHEDGRYLYPGTGFADETGRSLAAGTKLNIPMPMGADDGAVHRIWDTAEGFLRERRPEFILFQCGADGLAGDPIAHLAYTPATHAHVARRLCRLADECCGGRLVALGGGGYDLVNLSAAWCAVVEALLEGSGAD